MKFGHRIRAARLGWHELPRPRQGLMRITDLRDGWCCEFHPVDQIVPNASKRVEFRHWWDGDGGEELIASSLVLRSIKTVKRPFAIVLGEDGKTLRAEMEAQ